MTDEESETNDQRSHESCAKKERVKKNLNSKSERWLPMRPKSEILTSFVLLSSQHQNREDEDGGQDGF